MQFLQAYEVDAPTIRTIFATITGVFPYVETWQSAAGDMLLVASMQPVPHSWQDVDRSFFGRRRAVRRGIARSRGVPPYVIFHDATL